eukprot:scaffold7382_cov406-Prasinococcus_capsulatus_cf.AAC.17
MCASLKYYGVEPLSKQDVFLSYLPLAHIFDRVIEEAMCLSGGAIGYWRGDIQGLLGDLEALKPTFFIGVPRVFERIYQRGVGSLHGIKKLLFNFFYNSKLNGLNNGVELSKASFFGDMLVFSKVKAKFGGNVRLMISGGAPLASHVEDFLRVASCSLVSQGYGLTESIGASFCNPFLNLKPGTVGVPLPTIEFTLEAVEDMNYSPFNDPPSGEICLRGQSMFSGYYKQEDLTAEVVDEEGFFHTGDIGIIDTYVKIVDRKKNIFKLSQGEYVQVEKLENIYGRSPIQESVWVYGNSFERVLVAVVVPVEAPLMAWAKGNGVEGDFATVCQSKKAADYVQKSTSNASLWATAWLLCPRRLCLPKLSSHLTLTGLEKLGKENKLKGFEIVKKVHLEPKPFSIDENLLTPTLKKKRPQLQKKYQSVIDELYREYNAGNA